MVENSIDNEYEAVVTNIIKIGSDSAALVRLLNNKYIGKDISITNSLVFKLNVLESDRLPCIGETIILSNIKPFGKNGKKDRFRALKAKFKSI